ncbi:MAG TPA: LysM peptidoglycan-binding domain-containing M23 family metallopeptidase [Xanthobacteraceae bacterium]|jgi:murein DD-endopeptidase MepM/ murein hydrolase activator NlpD|nr:LysM peptidoglycan-binding domain-containing M23 family metallopeptidase [Xanthobacteraceae bacterium]
MSASRRPALWPQIVAISLIGLGAAACSADSGRFNEGFGSSGPPPARSDVTGSIPQTAPASRIESRPLPHLAAVDNGSSGGGRGMGSYAPGGSEVTGSINPPPPPPPAWTWEGGTPITVGPGDTIESIARAHGVPASAIMQSNSLSGPSAIYPGQHLVIPRYRSSAAAAVPPAPRMVAAPAAIPAPVGPPRSALVAPAGTHIVAPGETLNSIARLYGKPVMVIAKANNIFPGTMVRVGDRLVIPEMREAPRAAAAPATVVAAAAPPTTQSVAAMESPHSARVATPTETPAAAEDNAVKTAEPAGNLPGFRWPVRGRIIAAFGPKPNGLQNDGINLAVPEGTPVKAAEDGVVAYAGSELKGYGNLVLVRHANGFVTAYANASDILVKRGDTVKRGQVIAHSGQSGNVTSPQLHFEIRKGATPVDPSQYLNGA